MIVASILALVLSFAFDFALPEELISAPAASDTRGGDSIKSSSTIEPKSDTAASTAGAGEDAQGNSERHPNGIESTIPAGLSLLPVVAFFFGFYPKRASLAIERVALKVMKNIISEGSYRALPLSMLAGMSYSHELRLEREGFDNIENLSSADAVDLAVRTYFSYGQLKQWIDQAWLAAHLREDYPDFVRRTGIGSSDELQRFLSTCDGAKIDGVEQLVAGLSADPTASASWKLRLTALKILLNIGSAPGKIAEIWPKPSMNRADIVLALAPIP